jgi:signal transduction histidine kinase/CheY-like chemotaxis protein
MNAYAGSLAWSNFFSRLTHSHPGRVVWLVFNVAIALLLMELGIYTALERILSLFAVVAVAWLGAIVADLAINKPLGLSPPGIEFKRAHLYDINPVGVGAMGLATLVALLAASGLFGSPAQALAPFIALGVALATAPAIAWATGGAFYLARKPRAGWARLRALECRICNHAFEPEDMAYCPAYAAPICSLCCSLDARCQDLCKPQARAQAQIAAAVRAMLPQKLGLAVSPNTIRYGSIFALLVAVISLVLLLIDFGASSYGAEVKAIIDRTLWAAFAILFIVAGILAWFFVLAGESRRVAQEETARQTTLLLQEIEAHKRTDVALQRAKEVAEAANQAKSRYVVGLSHELRTPLNAVLGYAQLLERDTDIPAARQGGIRVIRRSAEHLSGLIDGLLDVSKIEAGRLQIQRNEVRTAEFLSGLVDMFQLQAKAKALDFRFEASGALPPIVRTDEKRLRQILINLLSNAIKFTPQGHVGLSVTYRNQIATFCVEDSGPGIAPEDQERIFAPFDRGSAAGAEAVPGLGLGLTITKLLTELMGGQILLLSTPGRGATFRVRLMLTAVDNPTPAVARHVLGYHGRRRTLLIVDDDQDHQALMRAILEPLGFAVLAARDGPTCLGLVDDIRPDLLFLDISMPGMSGWEVARALRGSKGVQARIVMLSANVGESAPVQVPGAVHDVDAHDAVLPKPFDLTRLLETLEALLKLDWIESPKADPPTGAVAGVGALRHPGADVVRDLLHLGAIGYVRGIETRLEGLGREPDHRPLVETLRRHLRNFNFDRYTEVLESLEAGGHGVATGITASFGDLAQADGDRGNEAIIPVAALRPATQAAGVEPDEARS